MSKEAAVPAGTAKKGLTKRLVGFVLGIVVLVAAMMIPGNEELSHEAIMSLGILLFAVVFWIFAAGGRDRSSGCHFARGARRCA